MSPRQRMCDHPVSMRVAVRVAGWAMLAAVAAPAGACLSAIQPEAVLFDGPPARPPPGYHLIRVTGALPVRGRDLVRVNFVQAAELRQFGPIGWLFPDRPSSCLEWGRLGAPAYVIARPAGRLRGRVLLEAKVYERSWWDRFWNFFGITRYSAE